MRLLAIATGIVFCTLGGGSLVAATPAKRSLGPAQIIETARWMISPQESGPANPDGVISISPDGARYVARLVRGDPERNGVWMELITGGLDSLDAARHSTVARLFSTGLGSAVGSFGSNQDTLAMTPVRWLDDEHVVFIWSNSLGIRQVVCIDLRDGRVEFLTDHPTPVVDFDINAAGIVLYTAQVRQPQGTGLDPENGFVLPDNADAYAVFRRELDQGSLFERAWRTQWFVREPGMQPRELRLGGRDVDPFVSHHIKFSPDGRLALLSSKPSSVAPAWNRYTGVARIWIEDARRDPPGPNAALVQQLLVLDLAEGTVRPLWDAPTNAATDLRWSPDGRSLLLARTHLPAQSADMLGLDGYAAAVVDVATGQYRQLPVDLRGWYVKALRWLDADRVEITARGDNPALERKSFRKAGQQWLAVETQAESGAAPAPRVRIELRQDLNSPPRLFGVESTSGRERMILDPNPWLQRDFALGRVQRVEGEIDGGGRWTGLLFYPPGYTAQRRYPLVIQSTYGEKISDEFTLNGYQRRGLGLGPPVAASYAGQALASRGVAVLHVNVDMTSTMGTPAEAPLRQRTFEAVARKLIALGIADPEKIGLIGFSRNGYWVEYTLTHSEFGFAAAIAADNWDPSYWGTTLTGNVGSAMEVNGAAPFGAGLQQWLERAPGFNVERIKAPLRMVEQSVGTFGILGNWEIYSRLRYLNKPVEIYVMPDAERHGAHNSQNPRQILAVMQGTVDWFDFWLNGREDADPAKAQQYAGWRRLRALHEADRAKPPLHASSE